MTGGIQGQLAPLDGLQARVGARGLGVALLGPRAPQHRLHPLDQQALAERLMDVVVGAQVEAQDLVDLVIL